MHISIIIDVIILWSYLLNEYCVETQSTEELLRNQRINRKSLHCIGMHAIRGQDLFELGKSPKFLFFFFTFNVNKIYPNGNTIQHCLVNNFSF